MNFRRVNIEVARGAGDEELEVSLSSRDAGNPAASFTLPFPPAEVGSLVASLSQQAPRSGDVRGERSFLPRPDTTPVDPAAIGQRLYECLLPSGAVRRQYDRELAGLEVAVDRGVRLQLQLDPRAPRFAELANLPWELMFSPQGDGPQQLDIRVPFSRYIKLPASARRPPFQPPLRILVVMSSPRGEAALDLERERSRLVDAFAGMDGVQPGFLPAPAREREAATVEAIRDRLVDGGYHVLHFMGHGDFDHSAGEGVLLFETEDEGVDRVPGRDLAWRLADIPTLCLVFLNACNTACAPESGPMGDLAGVAHALMEKGLPAVVAMQFPITDRAAVAFSAKFYGRLAAGFPVDVAVGEGRRAILEAHARLQRESGSHPTTPRTMDTLEWATPVLFMRVHDGNLFPREAVPIAAAGAPPLTPDAPARDPANGRSGSDFGGSGSGTADAPGGPPGASRDRSPASRSWSSRMPWIATVAVVFLVGVIVVGWRTLATRETHTAVAVRVDTLAEPAQGAEPIEGDLRVKYTHGRGTQQEVREATVDPATRIAQFEGLSPFTYPDPVALEILCGSRVIDEVSLEVYDRRHTVTVDTFCGYGPFDALLQLSPGDVGWSVNWERAQVTLAIGDDPPVVAHPDPLGAVVLPRLPAELRGTRSELTVTCGGVEERVEGPLEDTLLGGPLVRIEVGRAGEACRAGAEERGAISAPRPSSGDEPAATGGAHTAEARDDDGTVDRAVTLTFRRKLLDGRTEGRCGAGVPIRIVVGEDDRGVLTTDSAGQLKIRVHPGETTIRAHASGLAPQTVQLDETGDAAYTLNAVCDGG